MVISYDYGHGTGQDRGASGILNEEVVVRSYGSVVVNELIRQGHTLVNCTPTNLNLNLMDSLAYRVNQANTSGSQLHLCFHANAFNGQVSGTEVEVASDNGEKYGQSILNEIVKLGFTNRGVKRPGLYVTKNTNMVAVLIEPFFCDSATDVRLYNPNTLGLAIAKGVINLIGGKPVAPIINIERKLDNMNVRDLQTLLNTLGVRNDIDHAPLVIDGDAGTKTLNAKAKAKVLLAYILG